MKAIRFAWLVVLAVAMLMPATSAFAQRRRGNNNNNNNTNNNNRNNNPPPRPQVDPALKQAIQDDTKEVTDDSTAYEAAQKAYDAKVNELRVTFEKGPEFTAAKQSMESAAADLETARKAAIGKLSSNDDYKRAKAQEAVLQTKLDKFKEEGALQKDVDDLMAQMKKLTDVTDKMEQQALAESPDYQDAKKKLADANASMDALRKQFKDSLASNTDLTALAQAKTDAQTKLTAARTKLSGDQAKVPAGASLY